MSDLKDLKTAIDEIEVSEQQKRRMYANIIEKAESRRSRSFGPLALKLAPVLSLCLVIVISAGLILPSFSNKAANDPKASDDSNIADILDPTAKDAELILAESGKAFEIDGITCWLGVYDLDTDVSADQAKPTAITANSTSEIPTIYISWESDGRLYVLSSNDAGDEETLWKIRDILIQKLELPADNN